MCLDDEEDTADDGGGEDLERPGETEALLAAMQPAPPPVPVLH